MLELYKGFVVWTLKNYSEKKLHWEGVEPPPLALGSKLEGKDDNRFTTSVVP